MSRFDEIDKRRAERQAWGKEVNDDQYEAAWEQVTAANASGDEVHAAYGELASQIRANRHVTFFRKTVKRLEAEFAEIEAGDELTPDAADLRDVTDMMLTFAEMLGHFLGRETDFDVAASRVATYSLSGWTMVDAGRYFRRRLEKETTGELPPIREHQRYEGPPCPICSATKPDARLRRNKDGKADYRRHTCRKCGHVWDLDADTGLV